MTIPRDEILKGYTCRVKTGCGWTYITLNYNKEGKWFEVFVNMGKAGGCATSQVEALGRLISISLRKEVEIEDILRQLLGISCYRSCLESKSCSDATAVSIQKCINLNEEEKKDEKEKTGLLHKL